MGGCYGFPVIRKCPMQSLLKNGRQFPLCRSIKFRFTVFFTLFVITVCSVITANSLNDMIRTVQSIFSEQARLILRQAVLLIDGDKFERLAKTLDEHDPFYQETWADLFALHESFSCKYLYTIARGEGNRYNYIIDGSSEFHWDDFLPIGTEDTFEENHKIYKRIMEKTKVFEVGPLLYDPEWGWLISAYEPIMNSQGVVVGILVADFDGQALRDHIASYSLRQFLFCLGCTALGIGLLMVFLRMIFRPLAKLSAPMKHIASGDLRGGKAPKQLDEVGVVALNLHDFAEKLRELVLAIIQAVSSLTRDAEKLRAQTERMTGSTTAISSEIEEIRRQAVEQDRRAESAYGGIRQMQERITALDEMLAKQLGGVERSFSSIRQITSAIEAVSENTHKIAGQSERLVGNAESGKQTQRETGRSISDMVGRIQSLITANSAITKIAARTNILSMNAAIEAAHAGEAGLGFAVVAEEIRGLSETSTKQSKIITGYIKEIERTITAIVEASEKSASSFANIDLDIQELSGRIRQVTAAVEDLNAGIRDIFEGMKAASEGAQAISEAGRRMKEESQPVFSEIRDLIGNIRTIMEQAELSRTESKELQAIAEEVLEIAGENDANADAVSGILSRFKV
jgi:methyl-accepting chemotaxis protein